MSRKDLANERQAKKKNGYLLFVDYILITRFFRSSFRFNIYFRLDFQAEKHCHQKFLKIIISREKLSCNSIRTGFLNGEMKYLHI